MCVKFIELSGILGLRINIIIIIIIIIIKRFRYIGIFYCFPTFGTILNIILFLSANSIAPKYLKKLLHLQFLYFTHR